MAQILVIGAGECGSGTEALWGDPQIEIEGVDIYRAETVSVVCDAHYLPYPNETFDGVWIQAVLEHVVEPWVVVAEIHRVLKKSGLIYAETPLCSRSMRVPMTLQDLPCSGIAIFFVILK